MAPNLLIVDDEEDIRDILSADFTSFGFTTHVESSGNRAIAFLKQFGPSNIQVVLSDLMMPDGSGLDLLEHMRLLGKDAPPVVLITGSTQIVVGQMLARGAEAVLFKPFSRSSLKGTIERAIEAREKRNKGERSPRYPVQVACTLHSQTGAAPVTGYVTNLAEGGLFIKTDAKIDPSTPLKLSITPPAGVAASGMSLQGQVRWTNEQGCGIQLLPETAESAKTAWNELINAAKTFCLEN